MRLVCFLAFVTALFSACSSRNLDPRILLQEPYTKVNYIADVTEDYKTVEVIRVQTRSLEATILNTIPKLYEKALEHSENREVAIGRLSISSYTKLEEFKVPYKHCRYVAKTVPVPHTSCSQGYCQTKCSWYTKYVRRCETFSRTELRNVSYQIASADVLTRK